MNTEVAIAPSKLATMIPIQTPVSPTEPEIHIVVRYLPFEQLNQLHMHKNNRNADKHTAYLARLSKSMLQFGFLKEFYIIVNPNMEILSGHHRYLAAKNSKLGVYYTISESFDLLHMSQIENIKKPWHLLDWFIAFANEGNVEYRKIVKFAEETQFQGKALIAILSQKTDEYQGTFVVESGIQTGEFKVYDWDDVRSKAAKVRDFKDCFCDSEQRHCLKNKFVLAVLAVLQCENYDHATMLKQAKSQQDRFCLQRTRRENIAMLQRIYNMGLSRTKRIKISATSKS